MLEFLKNYTGSITVNDNVIRNEDISTVLDSLEGSIKIKLSPKESSIKNSFTLQKDAVVDKSSLSYYIFVKPWMTQKSSSNFNFMLTWNNDVPMPLRVMQGKINKETPGMYNMSLYGIPTKTGTCSVCGRTLTNPISRLYGIGPECMNKVGIFSDITIEEAKDRLEEINNRIINIKWTGWIAKSAILEMTEVK